MKFVQALPVAFLVCTWFSTASGQTDTSGVQIEVDPAVHKLDGITQRMAAYLNAMPTFEVRSESRWTLDGENRQVGGSECEIEVRHPNSFHLRIGSEAAEDVSLECASDGETVTRLYKSAELNIFSEHEGGLKEILDDAMTLSSLAGSGIDLLARPDLHAYLMTSFTKVKDLGEEELSGEKAYHFAGTWHDGSQVDFWIAARREPVLLRWQRRKKLDLGDDQPHEVKTDCILTWKPNAELPADFSRIAIPDDAVEVSDLQHFLMEGRTKDLLGQPAPHVQLKLLDGQAWRLGQHRGKHHVVLFFFASWAAPSTNDMPAILSFVEKYENRGVVFYAIDVGEDAESVRAFVEKQKYTHPVVLDPEQRATAAYRITSLPVTVLIGKDGTVQAVHVGTSQEERALIRADMEELVAGNPLVKNQQEQ